MEERNIRMYDREAYHASFLKGIWLVFAIKVDGVNSGSGKTLAEMNNGGVTFLVLSKGHSY